MEALGKNAPFNPSFQPIPHSPPILPRNIGKTNSQEAPHMRAVQEAVTPIANEILGKPSAMPPLRRLAAEQITGPVAKQVTNGAHNFPVHSAKPQGALPKSPPISRPILPKSPPIGGPPFPGQN